MSFSTIKHTGRMGMTLCFQVLLIGLAFGQPVKYEYAQENGIQKITTYIVFADGQNQDSTLLLVKTFNPFGYILSTAVYEEGVVNEYTYYYEEDTILVKKLSFYNGDLRYSDLVLRQGGKLIWSSYDQNAMPTGSYSVERLDRHGRTKRSRIYSGGRLIRHYTYRYHPNGEIKQRRDFLRKEVYHYDREGRYRGGDQPPITLISEIEETMTDGKTLTSRIVKYNEAITTIGMVGRLSLEPGDILKTEKFKNEQGIIEFAQQWVNGVLVGRVVYEIERF
ncbi:MAG: hypothetical protein AAGF87_00475 [Bacteroidota bacterium]